jgi:hypothetical protein
MNEQPTDEVKSLTQPHTRIISAFPGTGKSYYHNNNKTTTLDSDSSEFSWVIEDGKKVRNPDFPNNYITHIKENIGKYDFIFVSSHAEVRQALKANCLFYYLVYPERKCKDMYLKRYKDRGSPDAFIQLISDNWDNWLRGCQFDEVGCKHDTLSDNWSITNMISHTICSENGESDTLSNLYIRK